MKTLTEITDWTAWNEAGRPHTFWGKHPKLQSMSAYLAGVESRGICSVITSGARKRFNGRISGMNQCKRECLHDAIFAEMDRIESKNGGQPDHPIVIQLCTAIG